MLSFFNPIQTISAPLVAKMTLLFCGFLLGFAFILEYFVELTPCPLCIAQRIFFFLIGLASAAFLWWPAVVTKRVVGIKITAYALLGGAIAARQVWMQWYPENLDPTRCGVSFGSFIDQFLQALGGSGDCAVVDWTLMHLSIAEWSLISFVILLLVGCWFLWKGFSSPQI